MFRAVSILVLIACPAFAAEVQLNQKNITDVCVKYQDAWYTMNKQVRIEFKNASKLKQADVETFQLTGGQLSPDYPAVG
jgi:hypothetical protein